MKCKHCDGVGFFGNGASQFKCVYCDGSGEVEKILCDNCSPRLSCSVYRNGDTRTECEFYQPMTEQEYIQTCNTEQLARIIYELMWHKEKYPELCVYPVVDSVVEWLKQPHKGGES